MKLLKNTQLGRSMVEMLGVLAIIGVLSVGGIAGYSKAMNKHKINNTLDKLSAIMARLVELKEGGANLSGVSNENLSKFGFDCDFDENIYGCKLPLGYYGIYHSIYNNNSSFMLDIIFQKSTVDMCTAFFTTGIHRTLPDDWWTGKRAYMVALSQSKDAQIYRENSPFVEYGAKFELTTKNILDICSICDDDFCEILINMSE